MHPQANSILCQLGLTLQPLNWHEVLCQLPRVGGASFESGAGARRMPATRMLQRMQML